MYKRLLWSMSSKLTPLAAVLAVASLCLQSAAQSDANKEAERQFELTVVDDNGKPVPEAKIRVRVMPRLTAEKILHGKLFNISDRSTITAEADQDGRLIVELPPKPKSFEFYVEQAGYGPYWSQWNSHEHPEAIPPKHIAELETGWTVGGVVVDGDGNPVAGVEANPSLAFKTRPGDSQELYVGDSFKTAADGTWKYASVPASMKEVVVSFDYPGFMPMAQKLTRSRFEVSANSQPSERIALDNGITIEGQVTDETGQPIVGALIRTKFTNDIRETTTGSDGRYQLAACPPRMTRVVVSAKGRALELKVVRVEPEMEPVDFTLKPGGHIRIRVVDEADKPIPKARIFFQTWRGRIDYFEFDHISDYADENGIWEWNEAPLDEFHADICRPDGMQLSQQPLIAREEEYIFRPPAALVVSGSVTDAKTGQPIKKFRVIPGLRNEDPRIGMNWIPGDSYDAIDGKYRIRMSHSYPAHLVRIEANGYEVAISRDIKTDEGQVTFDFKLQPSEDIAATILSHDRKPAVGAKVALGVAGSQISINNGEIDDGSTYASRVEVADAGRFSVPNRPEPFQLVITHPSGFAHLKSSDGPIPTEIVLTRWARVEGTFRVGSKPLADVSLDLNSEGIHSYGKNQPHIFTGHETTSGPGGRFVFERAFPGKGRLGRQMIFMVDDGATEVTSSKMVPVQLVAGETTHVDVGGDGRPVFGRLVPPANFNEKVLWNFARLNLRIEEAPIPPLPVPAAVQNDAKLYKAWWKEWQLTDEGRAWKGMNDANERMSAESPYFRSSIDRDGAFRIDDVTAGNYLLSVDFSDKQQFGRIQNLRFSVPPDNEAQSRQPIDLGVLQLER